MVWNSANSCRSQDKRVDLCEALHSVEQRVSTVEVLTVIITTTTASNKLEC